MRVRVCVCVCVCVCICTAQTVSLCVYSLYVLCIYSIRHPPLSQSPLPRAHMLLSQSSHVYRGDFKVSPQAIKAWDGVPGYLSGPPLSLRRSPSLAQHEAPSAVGRGGGGPVLR